MAGGEWGPERDLFKDRTTYSVCTWIEIIQQSRTDEKETHCQSNVPEEVRGAVGL